MIIFKIVAAKEREGEISSFSLVIPIFFYNNTEKATMLFAPSFVHAKSMLRVHLLKGVNRLPFARHEHVKKHIVNKKWKEKVLEGVGRSKNIACFKRNKFGCIIKYSKTGTPFHLPCLYEVYELDCI